jgi:transcriptional regulator with XRE-family HTH domain
MGWNAASTVSRIENNRGPHRLNVDDLARLAAIFGVPLRRLRHECVNCGGHPQPRFACLDCGARNDADRSSKDALPGPGRAAGRPPALDPATQRRPPTEKAARAPDLGELVLTSAGRTPRDRSSGPGKQDLS